MEYLRPMVSNEGVSIKNEVKGSVGVADTKVHKRAERFSRLDKLSSKIYQRL